MKRQTLKLIELTASKKAMMIKLFKKSAMFSYGESVREYMDENQSIKDCREMSSMFVKDARDYLVIARFFSLERYDKAIHKFESLDTASRDLVWDTCNNKQEALLESLYR